MEWEKRKEDIEGQLREAVPAGTLIIGQLG